MKTKILSTLALSGLTTLALALPASAAHEGSSYRGSLQELNGSGATGSVTIQVSEDGETMAVDLTASNLNLDGPHAMHIHGIVEGDNVQASRCPTSTEDADGDGIITVAEGAPAYGGVQVSLTTSGDTSAESALAVDRFPAGTSVDYSRAGIPIPDELKPAIGKLHVVVHGIDENGNNQLDMDQEERSSLDESLPREATAPALCGTLAATASTVNTGAGGTADTGTDRVAVAGLGASAVLGLSLLARRRRDARA